MKRRCKYGQGKLTSYNFMLYMLIICIIYIVCSLMLLLIVTIKFLVFHVHFLSAQALAVYEYHD